MTEQGDVVVEPWRRRSRWPEGLAALRHRNFALFFAGALLSNSGAWMQAIAVPYVMLQLTDSAAFVSLASFLLFVPIVVMGPLGGSLADRWDRRTLLLWCQAGQAVLVLALGVAWLAGVRSIAAVLALVVASRLVNGLNIPAWQAFVSELVPRDALLNAVTLNSAQFNGAKALGPALGGLVLWRFGPGTAFLLDGISFVAVIGALLLIRLPRRAHPEAARRGAVWSSFTAAARYGAAQPGILACFIVVTALGGLGSPFVQILPVFAQDVFGVGDLEYGLLGAAMGVGAVATLPVLVGPGSRLPRGRVVAGAMVAYGVAVVVFGMTAWYLVGIAAMLIAGGAYLALASALNTTIQLQVDEAQRGKVLAAYVMLLTASLPAGLLLQAGVVWLVGPQLTVVAFGAAFLAVYVALRGRGSYLSHLDDGDEAGEQPQAEAA